MTDRMRDAESYRWLRAHPEAAEQIFSRVNQAPLDADIAEVLDSEMDKLLCRCIVGPEWSGSPHPKKPATHWVCDDCGRTIEAES